MSRWRELGNNLTAVCHEQALAGTNFPEILAQAVLEFSNPNGLHEP
jgi:hypothetical protein